MFAISWTLQIQLVKTPNTNGISGDIKCKNKHKEETAVMKVYVHVACKSTSVTNDKNS